MLLAVNWDSRAQKKLRKQEWKEETFSLSYLLFSKLGIKIIIVKQFSKE